MMRLRLERMMALILLAIPAVLGVVGWKWMKDAVYVAFGSGHFFSVLFSDWHFYVGLILFLIALIFIGGFIFYRDAKQNRIQPRLRRKPEN